MLGKLLKYEIKATARIFLPLVAVLLVIAGINRLVSELSNKSMQTPQIISMILYVTILIGVFVMTLVVMIQRFYKNLLTDEGYLMFTLPVKAWQHITSKLVVSLMWTFICSIAAFISVLIIASGDILTPQAIRNLISELSNFFSTFGSSAVLVIIEIILSAIIGLASNVLLIYASIAIGHLFTRHRIIGAIVAFILLNTAAQVILTITGALATGFTFKYYGNSVNDVSFVINSIHSIMWLSIIYSLLFAVGYFVLTNLVLTKRLNLE